MHTCVKTQKALIHVILNYWQFTKHTEINHKDYSLSYNESNSVQNIDCIKEVEEAS